jgi:hypothetical protein
VSPRWTSIVLWTAAALLAVGLGFIQRMTGPSYPTRGHYSTADETVRYKLPRSHGGPGGLTVSIRVPSSSGRDVALMWRRYPTQDTWHALSMIPLTDDLLVAEIPHQPPAGKVEYWIRIGTRDRMVQIPSTEPVVARFRGSVRAAVLIPHIIVMFASLLLATRAVLEVMRPSAPSARGQILTAMALLIVGGLILGPLVQREAFGALWTGWPFGTDLTDNKTLVAVLAWLPAVVVALRRKKTRLAVITGWLVLMIVFSIPHSMRGSELDWENDSGQEATESS